MDTRAGSRAGRRSTIRRVAAAAITLVVAFLGWQQLRHFTNGTGAHCDDRSLSYLSGGALDQIPNSSRRPLPKSLWGPPSAPAVGGLYRLLGGSPGVIIEAQRDLAFASWLALGLMLCLTLRTWVARGVAVVLCLSFLLAPPRIGWMSWIGAESILDSLSALFLALALGLGLVRHRRLRMIVAAALIAVGGALCFTDDLVPWLVLFGAAAHYHRQRRSRRSRRSADRAGEIVCAGLAGVAVIAVVLMFVTGPGLTEGGRPTSRVTTRAAIGLAHLGFTSPDAQRALQDHGFPDWREFRARRGEVDGFRFRDADYAALLYDEQRRWLEEHALSHYVRWLLSRPLAAADTAVARFFPVVASDSLPPSAGARHGERGPSLLSWLRFVTASPTLLFLLLIAWPLMLRATAGNRLHGSIRVMSLLGAAGLFISIHSDPLEPVRNAYPYGQVLVAAVWLTLLAIIDHHAIGRAASEKEGSP